MIKLLPITSCRECNRMVSSPRKEAAGIRILPLNNCAHPQGRREIKDINEIPEWCPLDDAEVEKEWICGRAQGAARSTW